jgi:hypothetical protein
MCLEQVCIPPSILPGAANSKKGTATRDDIDTTLKLGMNHPMGPLQLGASPFPAPFSTLLTLPQPTCTSPHPLTPFFSC